MRTLLDRKHFSSSSNSQATILFSDVIPARRFLQTFDQATILFSDVIPARRFLPTFDQVTILFSDVIPARAVSYRHLIR